MAALLCTFASLLLTEPAQQSKCMYRAFPATQSSITSDLISSRCVCAAADYCLTFDAWTQLAAPRALFDPSDPLPKGAFTLALRAQLFSFNRPRTTKTLLMSNNNLMLETDGDSMRHQGAISSNSIDSIPSPGLASGGWHHVALSFDSATGIVQGFFDGKRTMNMTGFKTKETAVGTFGPGAIDWFAVNQMLYFSVESSGAVQSTSTTDVCSVCLSGRSGRCDIARVWEAWWGLR